jgi:hypothetical protein
LAQDHKCGPCNVILKLESETIQQKQFGDSHKMPEATVGRNIGPTSNGLVETIFLATIAVLLLGLVILEYNSIN